MADKTLTLADGRAITMRAPTEAEVLAYMDRRADIEAGLRPSQDANDDGDRQLEACVTAPPAAELADLLEDFPLLNQHLLEAFMDLAGADKMLYRRDDLIGEEYAKAGKRRVGFLFDPPPAPVRAGEDTDEGWAIRLGLHEAAQRAQLIVLTKLSRFEVKALQFKAKQEGRKGPLPSALAALARQHIATPSDRPERREELRAVFAAAPLLLPNLGLQLFKAAGAVLADEAGKA